MKPVARIAVVLLALFAVSVTLSERPVFARSLLSVCEPDGSQGSGAVYRICMPPSWYWNGDLVIWAHGYVDFTEPVAIPEDQLCLGDQFCIPNLVNTLGFGFATTSYSKNGLAVQPALDDVVDLVNVFTQTHGQPGRVYLVGASEGGIVTALALERHPEIFDGGLAACGPVGDFNIQIRYFGDFRVLFDYYFPGLMPGSPIDIPQDLIDNWDDHYANVIVPAVFDPNNQAKLSEFMRVAHAPFDASDPNTVEHTVRDGLWYNVFGTNDATSKLGGAPFDNLGRVYRGSSDDTLLNSQVQRFGADPNALAEIEARYQTTGILPAPIVTLHTTKDQQVPYMHEPLYRRKIRDAGLTSLHANIPVFRYGHCNFTAVDALLAFAVMVGKVANQPLSGVDQVLTDDVSRREFVGRAREYGLDTGDLGRGGKSRRKPFTTPR